MVIIKYKCTDKYTAHEPDIGEFKFEDKNRERETETHVTMDAYAENQNELKRHNYTRKPITRKLWLVKKLKVLREAAKRTLRVQVRKMIVTSCKNSQEHTLGKLNIRIKIILKFKKKIDEAYLIITNIEKRFSNKQNNKYQCEFAISLSIRKY